MDRFLGGSGWRNRDSAENPLVNAYRVAVEGDRASEWVRENERVSDKERASKRTSEWVRERERASERERDWRGRRVAEVVGGCSSRGGNSGGRKERLLASGRPRAAIINSGGMHYRDAGSVGEQPLGTRFISPPRDTKLFLRCCLQTSFLLILSTIDSKDSFFALHVFSHIQVTNKPTSL